MARFEKGQSGNPAGRPCGIPSPQAKLRKAIEADLPEIIAAMTEQAKAGDVQAARLLLDRTLPGLRPQDQPVTLPLGGDLGADGRAIIAAVGTSEITPEQAGRLLQGLAALARLVEVDELVERIERLEQSYRAFEANES